MNEQPTSKEGTDWTWCFDNPREAASEIDRLKEEIDCLYGTIEAFERAALEPRAVDVRAMNRNMCETQGHVWNKIAVNNCLRCHEHRFAEPPTGEQWPSELEATQRVASIMVGAAGKHAERVVELEAEVSTLRESLDEVNRLLSLHVAEVERLKAGDGPGEEDGPWAEGWEHRAAVTKPAVPGHQGITREEAEIVLGRLAAACSGCASTPCVCPELEAAHETRAAPEKAWLHRDWCARNGTEAAGTKGDCNCGFIGFPDDP